jgi:hypothetical protein
VFHESDIARCFGAKTELAIGSCTCVYDMCSELIGIFIRALMARAPQGASSGYPGGTLKGSRLVKHENLMFLPEGGRERAERAYYLRDTAHIIHFNPSRGTQADNSRGITETRLYRPERLDA